MLNQFINIIKRQATVIAFTICASTHAFASTPIVMGYWENWGTYSNFPMPNNAKNSSNPILSAQITGLTALAYAFLEITPNGTVQFSDVWSDLDPASNNDKNFCARSPQSCPNFPQNAGLGNFTAFTQTAVAHHVISVGGAGHDAAWEAAFQHPDQFVTSLQALVAAYPAIDWLDIDYEPVGGVPPQQVEGLIRLTEKIKQALPNVVLSYAIPANANSIQQFGQSQWQRLTRSVNYISVMGYDMHGPFDVANPVTALHSALVADNNDFSTSQAIEALQQVHVPSEKIILGMPMYGRGLGGVTAPGLGQRFTESVAGDLDESGCSVNLTSPSVCSGMMQYKTLVAQQAVAIPVALNNLLAGVYAYDAGKKQFVSYDNPASVTTKTEYAVTHQLAGVMFWALRFDTPVTDPQSLLAAADKVYGITPSGTPTAETISLRVVNNDPRNGITISLVSADKAHYFPLTTLTPKGQTGSDIRYDTNTSDTLHTVMHESNLKVLLTPANGDAVWCNGTLNLTNGSAHTIQVYFDNPTPNCLIN